MSNSLARAAVTIGGLFESAYYETEESSEETTELCSNVPLLKDPSSSFIVQQATHAPMKDLQFGIEDFKALAEEETTEEIAEETTELYTLKDPTTAYNDLSDLEKFLCEDIEDNPLRCLSKEECIWDDYIWGALVERGILGS